MKIMNNNKLCRTFIDLLIVVFLSAYLVTSDEQAAQRYSVRHECRPGAVGTSPTLADRPKNGTG